MHVAPFVGAGLPAMQAALCVRGSAVMPSRAGSLPQGQGESFRLKICAIGAHFSPGFVPGVGCWKRHISASHSCTLGSLALARLKASALNPAAVSITMNNRVPSRQICMSSTPCRRKWALICGHICWCKRSYSAINAGSSFKSKARHWRFMSVPILYSGNSRKPALEQELGAQFRSLDELLAEADFVCLVVPLSDKTRHLISTLSWV